MKKFFKNEYVKDSLTRAVKTVAQTAFGIISTSVLISEVNLGVVVSSSILAGITSLLMSVANMPETKEETE